MEMRQLISAAIGHHRAGQVAEAAELYRQALRQDPRQPDALNFLGLAKHQLGDDAAALELIEQAIAINAAVPSYHNNRGAVLKSMGRLAPAAEAFRQVIRLKPDHAQAHFNLATVLQALGAHQEALQSYADSLRHAPNAPDTLNNLGNLRFELGESDAALAAYDRALAIAPNYLQAQINRANVLRALGRLEAAEAGYRRALAVQPGHAEALNNLGLVLFEQNRLDAAAEQFRAAVAVHPHYAEAEYNLGNACYELGDPEAARAAYTRALKLRSDFATARLGLAVTAIPMLPSSETESAETLPAFLSALDELERWDRCAPGQLGTAIGAAQPFYLAYRPDDVTRAMVRFGALASAAAHEGRPKLEPIRPGRRRAAGGRLRLGVVSGHIRHHPVWDINLRGLVEQYDRERIDLTLYHTGTAADAETRWAEDQVNGFVTSPRSVGRWIERIEADAPDVLFYPEVGMNPIVGALAPLRLAPLQVAGWGHPVTTGLPSIDVFVSGEDLEPAGAETHYSERLVRLPGAGVYTDFGLPAVHPWDGPPRSPGRVRFALCHQPMKFDPAYDSLLTEIAQAAGPCEFWLATPVRHGWAAQRVMQRLRTAFAAAGLDPDAHLHAAPWMGQALFLGFLDAMDLLLDCPAFSGYTTAWQALHRGAPIVTLDGPFLRQRLAAGLLRRLDRTDQIAVSRRDYVRLAVEGAERSRNRDVAAAERVRLQADAPRLDRNIAAVRGFEALILGG
jgi:protein O-GlcNAc transferase